MPENFKNREILIGIILKLIQYLTVENAQMKKNTLNAALFYIGTTTALSLNTSQAIADSARIFNPDNSHYYQRFDRLKPSFKNAKAACKGLKAHVATLTDDAEIGFVYSQLVSQSLVVNSYYYLGAFYTPATFSWAWITGESYNGDKTPPPDNQRYYMAMATKDGGWHWVDTVYGDNIAGYICEWDGNHYVGTAYVPDLNNNGIGENAVLYHDYSNNKHTVDIRDPKTHKLLNRFTFDTSTNPPVDLVVMSDGYGSNIEVAVLSTSPKNNVKIKSITNSNAPTKSITFLTPQHKVRAISFKPNENGNSFSGLTVVGVLQNGKTTAETRDSSTGKLLYSDRF